MAHGNIYQPRRIDAALGNYFRPGNLAALRELALLWVADRVDEALAGVPGDATASTSHGRRASGSSSRSPGRPTATGSIRRAARMAAADAAATSSAVHVGRRTASRPTPRELLDRQRRLVEELGGVFREVVGEDVAQRCSIAPAPERHPDRARCQPPVALAAS